MEELSVNSFLPFLEIIVRKDTVQHKKLTDSTHA